MIKISDLLNQSLTSVPAEQSFYVDLTSFQTSQSIKFALHITSLYSQFLNEQKKKKKEYTNAGRITDEQNFVLVYLSANPEEVEKLVLSKFCASGSYVTLYDNSSEGPVRLTWKENFNMFCKSDSLPSFMTAKSEETVPCQC